MVPLPYLPAGYRCTVWDRIFWSLQWIVVKDARGGNRDEKEGE